MTPEVNHGRSAPALGAGRGALGKGGRQLSRRTASHRLCSEPSAQRPVPSAGFKARLGRAMEEADAAQGQVMGKDGGASLLPDPQPLPVESAARPVGEPWGQASAVSLDRDEGAESRRGSARTEGLGPASGEGSVPARPPLGEPEPLEDGSETAVTLPETEGDNPPAAAAGMAGEAPARESEAVASAETWDLGALVERIADARKSLSSSPLRLAGAPLLSGARAGGG